MGFITDKNRCILFNALQVNNQVVSACQTFMEKMPLSDFFPYKENLQLNCIIRFFSNIQSINILLEHLETKPDVEIAIGLTLGQACWILFF